MPLLTRGRWEGAGLEKSNQQVSCDSVEFEIHLGTHHCLTHVPWEQLFISSFSLNEP